MKPYFVCTRRLEDAGLFESEAHKSRFTELINCYSGYPFFNSGLCKCMYLSSWDEEHFMVILDILNDMTLGRSSDTTEMTDNGKVLEAQSEGYEKYIMQLSGNFLNDEPFLMPSEPIESKGLYIITQALHAAQIIDDFFED